MKELNFYTPNKAIHTLDKLIQESIDIMGDLADQQNIKIDYENLIRSAPVNVDEAEFNQVLTNLIRNSIQAIKKKKAVSGDYEAKIKIFTGENNGFAFTMIQDDGIGIDEENQTKIFEMHFSTKLEEGGTGLGLNISRRFIRSFSGDLYLKKSTKGDGSVFVIKLPIEDLSKRGAA